MLIKTAAERLNKSIGIRKLKEKINLERKVYAVDSQTSFVLWRFFDFLEI